MKLTLNKTNGEVLTIESENESTITHIAKSLTGTKETKMSTGIMLAGKGIKKARKWSANRWTDREISIIREGIAAGLQKSDIRKAPELRATHTKRAIDQRIYHIQRGN